jgi:hypothetical protein
MPPVDSFFLDKKGTKKSRPVEICLLVRPLAGEASEIPEKNIFLRNFFDFSETANFKMAEINNNIFNNS